MSQLIYHPLPAVSRTSPFDECAIKVAQSGAIRIVSPYIGVGYLERLIALSPEWHLISDVEAWLSSLSFRARPRAWAFIRANLQRIHHCPDIHAKVVLSPNKEPRATSPTGVRGMMMLTAETADTLGISRKNLWEKMRKLGIDRAAADDGSE